MLNKRKGSPAQSTLEYAVLIVLVAIALIATQVYVKRALQGRLRSTADDLGEQFSAGAAQINTHVESDSTSSESTNRAGSTSRFTSGGEDTSRIVNMSVEAFTSNGEFWLPCDNDGTCEAGENHASCPGDCP